MSRLREVLLSLLLFGVLAAGFVLLVSAMRGRMPWQGEAARPATILAPSCVEEGVRVAWVRI